MHSTTPSTSSTNAICWALIAFSLAILPGCVRTPAETAGLLSEQVVVESPILHINRRTEWILAVPEVTEPQVWVTLEHAGERKLFMGVVRDGVAYELYPVSAASHAWVRAASQGGAVAQVHTSLDGIEVTHPIGYLEVASKDVKWLGGAPDAKSRVVALSPSKMAQERFSAAVIAVGRFDGAAFLSKSKPNIPGEDRVVLLVPDGRLPEDNLVVGWAGEGNPLSLPVGLGERIEVRDLDAEMPRDPRMFLTSVARPLGLDAGVDVVMWEYEGRVYLASSDPGDAMLGQEGALPAAIAEEVMVAANNDSAALLLEAYAAFREGSALGALYFATRADFTSRGNARAGRLRAKSLVGDADRAQWLFSEITRDGGDVEGAEAFYLLRALASEGDLERVFSFAPTARGIYARWPATHRGLAMGRTDELLATLLFARQERLDEAYTLSLSAAKSYEYLGDFLAVARVELLRAAIAAQLGKADEANLEAKRARSHAYHGNDVFSTAEAELELAELHLNQSKYDEAAEVAGYALARMQEIENAAGVNRANIVLALIAQSRSPGSIALKDFEEMFRVAKNLRDDAGMASAASAILLAHGGESLEELAVYGRLLGEGRGISGTPSVVRREQAFASICAQGLLTYLEEVDGAQRAELERACARAVARYKVTVSLVASWIARGWSDWMRGRDEQVASLLGQLSRALDEDWRERNPEVAIHAALLESVVTGKTDGEQIDKVLAQMAKIDAARRAPYSIELAHAMRARGQQDIALRVLTIGALHARAARQKELYGQVTLMRLDALAQAGQYDVLKTAVKEATLRFEKAELAKGLPGAKIALARLEIATHEGDRAGVEQAFAEVFAKAKHLEGPTQMEVVNGTAEVLIEGGYHALAASALERADSLAAGMPIELSNSLETKRQDGVAKYLRATIAAHGGDLAKANASASEAAGLLSDDPAPLACAYRAKSLALLGAFEPSESTRADISRELELLQKMQEPLGRHLVRGGKDQAGVVATLRARAELLYIDGRASDALEVLDELSVAGISPRLDAGQAACERGLYTVMAGDTTTGRELLRACAAASSGWDGSYATAWEFLLGEQPLEIRRQALERTLKLGMSAPTPRNRDQFASLLDATAVVSTPVPTKVEGAFASAKDDLARVKALEAHVDALLDRGAVARAAELLDAHGALFYELDGEWPAHLVRLRAKTNFVNLRPDKNISYITRAQAELPIDTPATLRAEIALLGARSALAAGQWGVATKDLKSAYQYAKEADEKALLAKINALSERFSIPLKSP